MTTIDIWTQNGVSERVLSFEGELVWGGYSSDGFVAFHITKGDMEYLIPLKEIKQITIGEKK